MAPRPIDSNHFSPDISEFVRLLHDRGVEYLIVGGEAVIFYGHARLTGDVDFFYRSDETNVNRLLSVLHEFWEGNIPGDLSADDLSKPGEIIQFGRPPNRIDLLNRIDGVTFEDAWESRTVATLEPDSTPVPFIGIARLIENKRASSRPKDLDDLNYLESV